MRSRLAHCGVQLRDANAFVAEHHRHHKPVVGHKFSLGAVLDGRLVGVAIVGRPVSRMRDDGKTLEVTRLCTDGTRNACSFLYGAAARACFALGYQRIGTYVLASETGGTLKAAGWRLIGQRGGGSWDRPSRRRSDSHPIEPKLLFEFKREIDMEDNGSAAGAAPLTVRLAYVPAPPIRIDTDIPVPPHTRGRPPTTGAQQALRALEVGHSFLFPESKGSAKTINNASRSARRIAKETGRKFTARTVIEDGRNVVRVWRVA